MLSPVPISRVRIHDAFWAPRQETNRTATLPLIYRQCQQTGRIGALKLDWKPGQPNPPHIFWESDLAKWMEAASYSLRTHPDAGLSGQLEDLIGLLAKAQQPDGYIVRWEIISWRMARFQGAYRMARVGDRHAAMHDAKMVGARLGNCRTGKIPHAFLAWQNAIRFNHHR